MVTVKTSTWLTKLLRVWNNLKRTPVTYIEIPIVDVMSVLRTTVGRKQSLIFVFVLPFPLGFRGHLNLRELVVLQVYINKTRAKSNFLDINAKYLWEVRST